MLVEQLIKYYEEREINSNNKNIDDTYKGKVWSSAAAVGENYDKLKIVVISSERAQDHGTDEVPHTMGNDSGAGHHKGRHWYRTIALVAEIAKELKVADYSPEKNLTYFAHLTASKYKEIGSGTQQGSDDLFDFCKEENYIKGELEILQPSIIWTQGEKAEGALNASGYFSSNRCIKESKNDNSRLEYRIEESDARIWIRTPHPTSRHVPSLYKDGRFKKIGEIIAILKQHLS